MNELSLKDLRKLLSYCREMGVASISVSGVSVVFSVTEPRPLLAPSTRQTKAMENQTKLVEKEALEDASRDLDEEEVENMLLENPSLHEQLIIEKELEDARSVSRAEDPQHQ